LPALASGIFGPNLFSDQRNMPSTCSPLHARTGVSLIMTLALSLPGGPAWAGSITASSIISEANAKQRAMEQIPKNATVVSTRCQSIGMRGGDTSYRCSVEYEIEPAQQDQP
jgi:hypothetical protein